MFSFFTQELAIDLGTANTIIIYNDKIVVDEPSIVAMDRTTGKLIAIGRQARQMQGKTHEHIYTVRPLRDGVIADFVITERMLGMLIKKATEGRSLVPPRVVICVPGGSTQVERKAFLILRLLPARQACI